jgi:putative transposase
MLHKPRRFRVQIQGRTSDTYIKDYERIPELESGLTAYFRFYDEERPHQSLDYRTPGAEYRAGIYGDLRGEES